MSELERTITRARDVTWLTDFKRRLRVDTMLKCRSRRWRETSRVKQMLVRGWRSCALWLQPLYLALDQQGLMRERADPLARGSWLLPLQAMPLERVSRRRRKVKQILVAEAGGCCALCSYDRCVAALHFHHLDPSSKQFHLSMHGAARSIASARAEMAKCVLLCANCHAEVEAAGIATLEADAIRSGLA